MTIIRQHNKQKILLLGDNDIREGVYFSNMTLFSLKKEILEKSNECEIVIYVEHGMIKVLKNVWGHVGEI